MHDVIVVGGSISGLLCAREISRSGFSTLVLEENAEIGTPEHCSGLVSMAGLEEMGILPTHGTFDNTVTKAEIFAPNGRSITIDAKRQKIVRTDRRGLDKQAAHQAQYYGTRLVVNAPVRSIADRHVRTRDETIRARIIVDARGISSLAQQHRHGIIPSAQCEIRADWTGSGIRIFLDQSKYPGFFAWIIPGNDGAAKVGVAGREINASRTLEDFLNCMGRHSVLRRVFAPIWVGGPISKFVNGTIVTVGDAAGQTKPTTAGGIYTAGMGGILGGRAVAQYLQTGQTSHLCQYQRDWEGKFKSEFTRQLRARSILERLDNDALNDIFAAITPEVVRNISEQDDFDFHTGSIARILGLSGSLKVIKAVVGGELKRFV